MVLAGLMAAGMALAADGGTFTFKTYFTDADSILTVSADASAVESAADGVSAGYYMALTDKEGVVLTGKKAATLGNPPYENVVAKFKGDSGLVTAGGTWSIHGIDQGKNEGIRFMAFKGPGNDPAQAQFKVWSEVYYVAFGGNDLVPPVPAGKPDFTTTVGAKVLVVPIPEPSVFALGLLGLGAFLIRRRS